MQIIDYLKKSPEKAGIITCILIILVLLPLWHYSGIVYQKGLIDSEKEQFHSDFSFYSNSLTYTLNQRIGIIEALFSFVLTNPDEKRLDHEFESYASTLHGLYPGIRTIAVAPDGVFSYVYPVENNEEIVGYSLLDDLRPAVVRQNRYLLEGKPNVQRGPVEFLQGGEGLIITKAVFLNGSYEDGDLWGFVIIGIDMPEMYSMSGISVADEYSVAIKNDDYGTFYGNEAVFEEDPEIYEMKIGNEIWTFAIVPKEGWLSLVKSHLDLFRTVTFVLVILAGFFGGYTIYSQMWLNTAVIERTRDLEKAQKELLFRNMAIESSVSPVVISDRRGGIVYMNRAALTLWHMDDGGAAGKDISDLFCDKDIITGFFDGARGKESWTGDLRGEDENGRGFILHGSISPVTDESGNIHGVHGSFVDITAGIKAEEELLEKESKYQAIFDSVSEIVILNRLFSDPHADMAGRIVEANTAGCEMLGYSRDELLSMKINDVLCEISRRKIPEYTKQLVLGEKLEEELCLERKNKSTFPVLSKTRLLTLGKRKYALSLIHDLTFEKEMRKREMEALKHIEENLVSLAALNDEIRNPLAVIVGYVSLEGGEYAEKILSQAEIIDQLINRLDKRWLESEKIREYLKKYYGIEKEGNNED